MKKFGWVGVITILCVTFIVGGCVGDGIDKDILEALSDVHKGTGVDEAAAYTPGELGPHPIMLLDVSGKKHEWTDRIPEDWQPTSLEDVELVVFVEEEKENLIETCYYIGGPAIKRLQYSLDVQLREAKTGKLVAKTTLNGPTPRSCMPVEEQNVREIRGSHVSFGQMKDWLQEYVTGYVLVTTLTGHDGTVTSVDVDKHYIYSGSMDKMVRVWDKTTWTVVQTLDHTDWVLSVFTDEHYLYTGSKDDFVRVWDKATWSRVRTLIHTSRVDSVFADEYYLYSGAGEMVWVWDKATWSLVTTLEHVSAWHTASMASSVFADEYFLYSGAQDKKVRVWDKTTWSLVTTLEDHTEWVFSVFADEHYLYSGSQDETVRVWDKATWSLVTILEGHTEDVKSVFADQYYLYSSSQDGTVRIWDKATWSLVATLEHPGFVHSVVVDEHYLYSGGGRTVRVWDKATWS